MSYYKRRRYSSSSSAEYSDDEPYCDYDPIPATFPDELSKNIHSLDITTLRDILHAAATAHPDVLGDINARIEAKQRAEAERVIDFDYESKQAWKELHITHANKRSSTQYDLGYTVAANVEHRFNSMAKKAPASASYGTKRNAVETMRKICKSILMMPGSELRKVVCQNVGTLPEIMLGVLKGFKEDELRKLVNQEFDGQWLAKLKELIKLNEGYYALDDLKDVYAFCKQAVVKNNAADNPKMHRT